MGERLTPSEAALMSILRRAWPHTVDPKALRERIPSIRRASWSVVVKVHVHNIRRKLGKDAILTFRGGYCAPTPHSTREAA